MNEFIILIKQKLKMCSLPFYIHISDIQIVTTEIHYNVGEVTDKQLHIGCDNKLVGSLKNCPDMQIRKKQVGVQAKTNFSRGT